MRRLDVFESPWGPDYVHRDMVSINDTSSSSEWSKLGRSLRTRTKRSCHRLRHRIPRTAV
jgi:hypothetical protein